MQCEIGRRKSNKPETRSPEILNSKNVNEEKSERKRQRQEVNQEEAPKETLMPK